MSHIVQTCALLVVVVAVNGLIVWPGTAGDDLRRDERQGADAGEPAAANPHLEDV